MEIAERFGDKFFMKKGEDGQLHLPKQHNYYAQVQGELAVTNREWCDFVVYSNGEVVVDRILADLEPWKKLWNFSMCIMLFQKFYQATYL